MDLIKEKFSKIFSNFGEVNNDYFNNYYSFN